ncbi:MAG: hypothetical protein K5654_06595 [Lachnospiraceae bacterium]|nr:hypothetical protein [Lachnospiraceae bacterium]
MKQNNIKIDKTEIEQGNLKISLQRGVDFVSSNIVDDSDIGGWRFLIDECSEVDTIRKYLCESEDLLIENIETFRKTWTDLDQNLADNM